MGKSECRSRPRPDRVCGRANDRSEADGVKPAEGRTKVCDRASGNLKNRMGDLQKSSQLNSFPIHWCPTYPTASNPVPDTKQVQNPRFSFPANRNGTKNNSDIGTAKNMLFAYVTEFAESFHSICENAKASIEVSGRAVKNPARSLFFPESQDTMLIRTAATSTFPIINAMTIYPYGSRR